MKGVLLGLIFLASCSHTGPVSCGMLTEEGFDQFPACASVDENESVTVTPAAMKKIGFNPDGLAEFSLRSRGCYWVNRQGLVRRTHCFDNGSDPFVEGLSRYVGPNGKFGFMDKNLTVVIPPQFDFTFPFENGRARFCQGCRKERSGDYGHMTAGIWGEIDEKGGVILP